MKFVNALPAAVETHNGYEEERQKEERQKEEWKR